MKAKKIQTAEMWPCACVKRDKKSGRMTHIKLNAVTMKRCRVCGARPLPDERIRNPSPLTPHA